MTYETSCNIEPYNAKDPSFGSFIRPRAVAVVTVNLSRAGSFEQKVTANNVGVVLEARLLQFALLIGLGIHLRDENELRARLVDQSANLTIDRTTEFAAATAKLKFSDFTSAILVDLPKATSFDNAIDLAVKELAATGAAMSSIVIPEDIAAAARTKGDAVLQKCTAVPRYLPRGMHDLKD